MTFLGVATRHCVSVLRLVGRPWHWGQGQAQQKIVHIFSQAMQGAHNTCVVQQQHILALQGILQDPALSNSSKHTYAQRLMAISTKLRQPISELAKQPMTVLPWIKKQYPEVATQKNIVTAVLAALRRMPATEGPMPESFGNTATGFQTA